jgi:hypothetical protein
VRIRRGDTDWNDRSVNRSRGNDRPGLRAMKRSARTIDGEGCIPSLRDFSHDGAKASRCTA